MDHTRQLLTVAEDWTVGSLPPVFLALISVFHTFPYSTRKEHQRFLQVAVCNFLHAIWQPDNLVDIIFSPVQMVSIKASSNTAFMNKPVIFVNGFMHILRRKSKGRYFCCWASPTLSNFLHNLVVLPDYASRHHELSRRR